MLIIPSDEQQRVGKVLKLTEKRKEKEKSWGKIEYYSKVAAQLVGFCQDHSLMKHLTSKDKVVVIKISRSVSLRLAVYQELRN